MTSRTPEDVWSYPRPPLMERVTLPLSVVWHDGTVIAHNDRQQAFRVCETSHPPTYYFAPEDVRMDLLQKTSRSSFCEWKGVAAYFSLSPPDSSSSIVNRVWCYPAPTKGTQFGPLKDHLSFYASAGTSDGKGWKCFVDGEEVTPQEGDFYGGWKSSWHTGKMKGGPGTRGW